MKKHIEWDKVSKDIEKINEIASKCSDSVQEKCFELLFNMQFGKSIMETDSDISQITPTIENAKATKEKTTESRKLPGNVLAMLKRNKLGHTSLEKLYLLDHDPIMSIYNLDASKLAPAQVNKTMMILLENAFTTNEFKAEYTEIRQTLQEEGLYDSNLTANLRKTKSYFKGSLVDKTGKISPTDIIELSGLGIKRLAELIQELG